MGMSEYDRWSRQGQRKRHACDPSLTQIYLFMVDVRNLSLSSARVQGNPSRGAIKLVDAFHSIAITSVTLNVTWTGRCLRLGADGNERDGAASEEGDGRRYEGSAANEHGDAVPSDAAAAARGKRAAIVSKGG